MKTLYLECGMGAAGDMLMAALWELLPDREAFVERMNRIGLPGVRVIPEPSVKAGITGTHMRVLIDGEEEEAADEHYGCYCYENKCFLVERHELHVYVLQQVLRQRSAELLSQPLVLAQTVLVNQTGEEHCGEERADDTDDPCGCEAADRTSTCYEQDDTGYK